MTSIVFGADNKSWIQIIYAAKKDNEVSIKTEIGLEPFKTRNFSIGILLLFWSKKIAVFDFAVLP